MITQKGKARVLEGHERLFVWFQGKSYMLRKDRV